MYSIVMYVYLYAAVKPTCYNIKNWAILTCVILICGFTSRLIISVTQKTKIIKSRKILIKLQQAHMQILV